MNWEMERGKSPILGGDRSGNRRRRTRKKGGTARDRGFGRGRIKKREKRGLRLKLPPERRRRRRKSYTHSQLFFLSSSSNRSSFS